MFQRKILGQSCLKTYSTENDTTKYGGSGNSRTPSHQKTNKKLTKTIKINYYRTWESSQKLTTAKRTLIEKRSSYSSPRECGSILITPYHPHSSGQLQSCRQQDATLRKLQLLKGALWTLLSENCHCVFPSVWQLQVSWLQGCAFISSNSKSSQKQGSIRQLLIKVSEGKVLPMAVQGQGKHLRQIKDSLKSLRRNRLEMLVCA